MDRLYLVKPAPEYDPQLAAFRAAVLASDEDPAGMSWLCDYTDMAAWRAKMALLETDAALAEGLVPAVQYLTIRVSDGKLVGMVNLRLQLNDYLRNFAGHIGYSVSPDERGKGYGKEQLRLALIEAGKLGFEKLLICCARENIPSRRTILALGGEWESTVTDSYDGEVTERYWVKTLPAPIGVYIHVPFCASKCGYCDFYSRVRQDQKAAYLDALINELRSYRRPQPIPVDTVFFGIEIVHDIF